MRNIHRIAALIAALVLAVCALPALAVQADTVTKQCSFEVDSGEARYLTDGNYETVWKATGTDSKMLINLPANGAGYVVIEWETEPTGFIFAQYDEQQGPIDAINQNDAFGGLVQVFELDPDARYVMLTLTRKGQSISEVSVYSAGDLPGDLPRWSAPYVKADIMLVCAYPGDEFVTFTGILPHYAVKGENRVQLVYMTEADRSRVTENQNALWSLGITAYPIYLDLPLTDVNSAEQCVSAWGGKNKLIGTMVEAIRMGKPEVIVSHATDSADPRRSVTAMLMMYAVEAAADPTMYPESAEKYGVWQVKKLYLQGGTGEVIDFDWSVPYTELNGATPIESAAGAFEYYTSLRGKYTVAEISGAADTSVYHLEFSMIGEDVRRDCFFENLPSLYGYVDDAPTPEPTEEPTPVPALVFSPEPTATPNPQAGTAEEFAANIKQVARFVGFGVIVIILICCLQAVSYQMRGKKKRRY